METINIVGDSDSHMKTKSKKRMVFKIALVTTILFYLISFGPFVAFAAYMGWDENPYAIWGGIGYLPHAILAAKSDAYNRYTAWWIKLADPELAASFRKGFLNGSMTLRP